MDEFFSILIPTAIILTTIVIAPIAFWLGWRQKNKRWMRATENFKKSGLFISRRNKCN